MAHVEQLWAQSTYEIKHNLLKQCQVICLDADFSKVGLDKIVINGHIEIALDDDDDGLAYPESDPTDPATNP